jgi:hypothetical protein
MGIDTAKNKNSEPQKRTLMGKIRARFSEFIDRIAKEYEKNPPCVG